MSENRVTFPHIGNYWIALRPLAELLGDPVVPPRVTRRTIELGARYSPEFVCVPFKYNLGTFIEALELGANVIMQVGGGCRLGYYSEVQEAILRDLGYDFTFLRLTGGRVTTRDILRAFKGAKPSLTMRSILRRFKETEAKARALDEIDDHARKNVGFEVERGSFERVIARFHRDLDEARETGEIERVRRGCMEDLRALPVDKPTEVLRVGIVGEIYVVVEPVANYFVERTLARHGVEVHRFVDATSLFDRGENERRHMNELIRMAGPYMRHDVGGHGTESVARTRAMMAGGFDGVVHIKPFGCMPEVSATAALQRISRENTFPILFMSCDAQTSETGVATRLEAFCDMLAIRRKRRCHA